MAGKTVIAVLCTAFKRKKSCCDYEIPDVIIRKSGRLQCKRTIKNIFSGNPPHHAGDVWRKNSKRPWKNHHSHLLLIELVKEFYISTINCYLYTCYFRYISSKQDNIRLICCRHLHLVDFLVHLAGM